MTRAIQAVGAILAVILVVGVVATIASGGKRFITTSAGDVITREEAVAQATAFAEQRMDAEAEASGVAPRVLDAMLTSNEKAASLLDGEPADTGISSDTPVWIVRVEMPFRPNRGPTQAQLNPVWEGVQIAIDARPDGNGVLALATYGAPRNP